MALREGGKKPQQAIPGPFVHRYTSMIRRARWPLIIFWTITLILATWQGPKLLQKTTLSIKAPSGSPAESAESLLTKFWPKLASETPIICVMDRVDGSSILGNDTRDFQVALYQDLLDYPDEDLLDESGILGYYIFTAILPELTDYAQQNFVCGGACNGSSTLMVIPVKSGLGLTPATRNLVKYLHNHVANYTATYFPDKSVNVRLTGDLVFGVDVEKGTERDLVLMDGVAFPIALMMLAYVLKSVRLLIIPIINIATSIMTAFLIMYPVALNYNVVSFAPSVMMSATIAMSIDYSLFLLTRYREELQRGRSNDESILFTLWSAGHTITVSGTTLALCFFGLMFFPVSILRTPGLGTGIAIIITLVVNLTLTPAILFTFDSFFMRCTEPWCRKKTSMRIPLALSEKDPLMPSKKGLVDEDVDDVRELQSSLWFRFGRFILQYKVSLVLLLVVTGIAVPCAMRALNFKRNVAITNATPRDAVSTAAYRDMQAKYGGGRLFPYQLIVVPPIAISAMSETTFNIANAAVKALQNVTTVSGPASFLGVMYDSNGTFLDYQLDVQFCTDGQHCAYQYGDIDCALICLNEAQFVTANKRALFVEVRLQEDPYSHEGINWLQSARRKLTAVEARYPAFTFALAGGATIGTDMQENVYSLFPTAIGATTAVVFVLIGLAFRSLVVPIRAIFSITLTLSFVYGAAVWVYQDGVLDGLHFAGLRGSGSLSWISPVMCFSVLVGLGLDYDVFLLSRIIEYRKGGRTNHDSILLGLTRTGHIITAAGLVMAIAFVGLLFSSEPVLNELSFFLVLAVLVDTFLIRSALVPAAMNVIGALNWWPAVFPRETQTYEALNS